jgi:hypothetical protein
VRFVHHSPQPAPIGKPRSSARQARGLGGPGFASGNMNMGTERSSATDAQAGVPSARWPRAQLAFKNSMVHGILQFTPRIAFRYVLHRCESLDIRCRESFHDFRAPNTRHSRHPVAALKEYTLASNPRRFLIVEPPRRRAGRLHGPRRHHRPGGFHHGARVILFGLTTMILPQVHLRKPCYDFSFL